MEDKFYFVKQFYNVISSDLCLSLIREFESGNHPPRRVEVGTRKGIRWWEINLKNTNENYHDLLVSITSDILIEYINILKLSGYDLNVSPWNFENIRIKKYVGGTDDRIDMHYDVGCEDDSRRCLAFLYYLNDDFTGGNTMFHPNHTIRPKAGSVLVFPPYWMYPHKGEKVISGNKYIMSTYLGIY